MLFTSLIVIVCTLFVTSVQGGGPSYPTNPDDAHFYPYGDGVPGDAVFGECDDCSTSEISASVPIGYFGQTYNSFWVSSTHRENNEIEQNSVLLDVV